MSRYRILIGIPKILDKGGALCYTIHTSKMFVYLNRIKYTICGHAETQMSRRVIKRTDVQSCLDDYDVKFTPVSGYSLYMADHPIGKQLQVIVNTVDKEIVSVVWLD